MRDRDPNAPENHRDFDRWLRANALLGSLIAACIAAMALAAAIQTPLRSSAELSPPLAQTRR